MRLIDAEALKKAIDTWDKFGYTAQGELIRLTEENKDLYVPYVKYQDIVNCIDNTPTVEERPTGEWKITEAYPHKVYCGECYKTYAQEDWEVWKDGSLPRNFCPNCGADMRKEKKE